jgi:hypothetical protein
MLTLRLLLSRAVSSWVRALLQVESAARQGSKRLDSYIRLREVRTRVLLLPMVLLVTLHSLLFNGRERIPLPLLVVAEGRAER